MNWPMKGEQINTQKHTHKQNICFDGAISSSINDWFSLIFNVSMNSLIIPNTAFSLYSMKNM